MTSKGTAKIIILKFINKIQTVNIKIFILPCVSFGFALLSTFVKLLRDEMNWISKATTKLGSEMHSSQIKVEEVSFVLSSLVEKVSDVSLRLLYANNILIFLSFIFMFITLGSKIAPVFVKVCTVMLVLWFTVLFWLFNPIA